jgi:fucose 4-O-acetylase-like acetyltransferase
MRIKIIDALKGVAIVAVVIGHILSFSGIQGLLQTYVYRFIWLIQIPAFFLVSGWLDFKIVNSSLILNVIFKKFIRLFIPFFSYIILYNLANGIKFESLSSHILYISNNLTQYLWFLYALLVISLIQMIVFFISNILSKSYYIFLYALISAIVYLFISILMFLIEPNFLGLKFILYYSVFYNISFIYKYLHINSFSSKFVFRLDTFVHSIYSFLISGFLLTLSLFFEFVSTPDTLAFILLRLIFSFNSFLFVFIILKKFSKLVHYFSIFGQYSIQIYFFHFFFLRLIIPFNYVYSLFDSDFWTWFLVSFITVSSLTFLSILTTKKVRFLSIILFGIR